ncbi:hypothetical protein [Bradyrhizobium sp.]|uniref:hypothetical protein n=1 Tax=Bradyrhizobium sp. TaxID=376 RepID=UPI0027246C32|nr:hypothetical protein [Bradyrhizobium sp.]MDO9299425.1 hypothetical protein [Bradyrhizobium sp.]
MFRETLPIAYDAPAELKKWPSLGNQRLNGSRQPYLVYNGTLAQLHPAIADRATKRTLVPAEIRTQAVTTAKAESFSTSWIGRRPAIASGIHCNSLT